MFCLTCSFLVALRLNRAGNFFSTAHTLIGYFDVTWHLTMKRFPAKILACVAGAKREGRGGREKGKREGSLPLPSPSPQSSCPFSLPPYPLPPTPFDACYAGYQNPWVGNIAKSMTSVNLWMLTAREIYFLKFLHEKVFPRGLYDKSFKDWSLGKQFNFVSLESQCFPR